MAANWKEYQDEAAAFFLSLGLDAESDVLIWEQAAGASVVDISELHHRSDERARPLQAGRSCPTSAAIASACASPSPRACSRSP